jgi:hypothetical protein
MRQFVHFKFACICLIVYMKEKPQVYIQDFWVICDKKVAVCTTLRCMPAQTPLTKNTTLHLMLPTGCASIWIRDILCIWIHCFVVWNSSVICEHIKDDSYGDKTVQQKLPKGIFNKTKNWGEKKSLPDASCSVHIMQTSTAFTFWLLPSNEKFEPPPPQSNYIWKQIQNCLW